MTIATNNYWRMQGPGAAKVSYIPDLLHVHMLKQNHALYDWGVLHGAV